MEAVAAATGLPYSKKSEALHLERDPVGVQDDQARRGGSIGSGRSVDDGRSDETDADRGQEKENLSPSPEPSRHATTLGPPHLLRVEFANDPSDVLRPDCPAPTTPETITSMSLAALHRRNLLKEIDLTPDEFRALLDLAAELKAAKREGREERRLTGKNIALLFAKTSTRTRCAFEVAAADQGASTTYLDPIGSQMGHKESAKDTARVLGRFYDGIEYRGAGHDVIETLGAFAGVPVWNGLTDDWHPTQSLCDALTMREHAGKPDEQIAYAYVGDARFNMGNSLLVTGALLGMDVRIVAPQSLWPSDAVVAVARRYAAETGARLTLTEDVAEGVRGVDFVHTDVWVSMGEPKEVWADRIEPAHALPGQRGASLR